MLAAFDDHALSKRTALYVSWAKVDHSDHASLPPGQGDGPLVVRAPRAGAGPSALSLGIRHTS